MSNQKSHFLNCSSSSFFSFFRLNSRISLTEIDQHLKLGEVIEFGDTQTILIIGIVKFV